MEDDGDEFFVLNDKSYKETVVESGVPRFNMELIRIIVQVSDLYITHIY